LIMAGLGLLAVAEPMIATLAVTIFAGWMFLVSGIVGLAGGFTARRGPGFLWGLITPVLAIALGIFLVSRPLPRVLSLALVVAAFLAAEGLPAILAALGPRGVLASWGWLLFSGIGGLLLAAIIISGWPGTAEWTLGLLFGINLFMWGLSLVMTALACRK